MTRLFSIGPWLMDLFNPPPRASLSFAQKIWRAALVVITLVTICIIAALMLSIGFFLFQRGREALQGMPQLRNAVAILFVSVVVNILCIRALFEIRRIDQRLIPKSDSLVGIEVPLPPRAEPVDQTKV